MNTTDPTVTTYSFGAQRYRAAEPANYGTRYGYGPTEEAALADLADVRAFDAEEDQRLARQASRPAWRG